MHCPGCRHENPITTRFCVACGRVLIEDAKRQKSRRGRRARLQVDVIGEAARLPGFLDDSATAPGPSAEPSVARFAADAAEASVRRRRYEWIAAAVLFAGFAAAYLRWLPDSPVGGPLRAVAEAPPPAAGPAVSPVAEETGAATIVEPLPGPSGAQEVAQDPNSAKAAKPRRDKRRSPPMATIAVAPAPSAPPLESVAAEPPTSPVAAAPEPDRSGELSYQLDRCNQGSFFERAFCDQRVRIAYCAGRWGQVAECPVRRSGD